jgi:uncharacterized protein YjdB
MKSLILKLAGAFATALALSFTACGGNDDIDNSTVVVAVAGVSLDKGSLTMMDNGAAVTLTATVSPSDADNKAIDWKSANATVATVTGSGATASVRPVAAGKTVVTATTADGGKTAICMVTVEATVTGLTLNPIEMDLLVGAPASVVASVQPMNAANQAITWTTSNPAVATVSGSGQVATVAAVAPGTAVITAATADGGMTADCTVTVPLPPAGPAEPWGPGVYVGTNVGLFANGVRTVTDKIIRDVFVDLDYNVHACGRMIADNTKAVYMRNGVVTVLPTEGTASGEVLARSMAVTNDGHVYIAGMQGSRAMLWRDGEIQPLANTATGTTRAISVAVRGGDVYVLGTWNNGGTEACLWLNGVHMPFGTAYRDTPSGMAVAADGTVYVSGPKGLVGIDIATGAWWDVRDSFGNLYPTYTLGTCASGNDVYAVGWGRTTTNDASYWDQFRNLHVLPRENTAYAEAEGVRVVDTGDVYVAGRDNSGARPVYWVNSVLHPLPYSGSGTFAYVAHARGVASGQVPIASVTMDVPALTVFVNVPATMTATVLPANATNPGLRWWTSNGDISGTITGTTLTVTATAVGTGTITARAFNGMEAVCQVTAIPVPAASISLAPTSLDLPTGYTETVTATLLPANVTFKTVNWRSSDESVATVTPTGLTATVKAEAPGAAIITASSPDGPTATLRVTVANVAVTGVSLPNTFEVGIGKTKSLTATIIPATATNKGATWSSSNTAVARVTGTGLIGSVTGASLGTAVITVTTDEGAKTDTCTVTVVEKGDATLYVAGFSGVYVNGDRDDRFPDNDPSYLADYGIEDVCVDPAGRIHAAFTYVNWDTLRTEAYDVVDGVMNMLPMGHGNLDLFSGVYAMTVDGNDVYIAGYVGHEVSGASYDPISPMLWKNGVIQPLQNNEITGEFCFADKVVVHNGIVYVGGYTDYNPSGAWRDHPVLWVNGEEHVIRTLDDYTKVRDFCVASNGRLYVLVENEYYSPYFTVWEVLPSNLDSWTKVFEFLPTDYGVEKWAEVVHIAADGNDWYIVGYLDDDAYYWKNGAKPPVKLQHPAGLGWVEADDIYFLDGDVYMAGIGGVDDWWDEFYIVHWLNGDVIAESTSGALPGGGDEEYAHARVRGLFANY